MAKSSSSGSSSDRWRNRDKGRVAGIPKSCRCGAGIDQKVSGTEENSYRRYYRCSFAYSQKLKNDPHVFKLVDEAFHNEINQLDYQVYVLEEEMLLLKTKGKQIDEEVLKEFEMSVNQNVEYMMNETICKMKRMMAMLFLACLVAISLVVVLKK